MIARQETHVLAQICRAKSLNRTCIVNTWISVEHMCFFVQPGQQRHTMTGVLTAPEKHDADDPPGNVLRLPDLVTAEIFHLLVAKPIAG